MMVDLMVGKSVDEKVEHLAMKERELWEVTLEETEVERTVSMKAELLVEKSGFVPVEK
jgi:hypothetical protein